MELCCKNIDWYHWMYSISETHLYPLFVFYNIWKNILHLFLCSNLYFVLEFILTCILIYTYCIHKFPIYMYTYICIHTYMSTCEYIIKISRKYIKHKHNACIHWFKTYTKRKTRLNSNFRTSQNIWTELTIAFLFF